MESEQKKHPIFGLVCSGGGAMGAYQAGVLTYIHEKFCRAERSPFQIFSGISCGSLNTTFYACRSSHAFQQRLVLEDMWRSFHVPEYYQQPLPNLIKSLFRHARKKLNRQEGFWSLFDGKAVERIVNKGFDRQSLMENFRYESTLGLAIAATDVVHCYPVWFIEGLRVTPWHLNDSIGLPQEIGPQHVVASCSVPFFLPPVKIHEHYFADGSINMTKPLTAAVQMGAKKILAISTQPPKPRSLYPYPSDFQTDSALLFQVLIKALSHDPLTGDLHSTSLGKDVELKVLTPSKDVENLLNEFSDTSDITKKKFSTRAFRFQSSYIARLIDFGYEEASRMHTQFEKFFSHP